MVENGNTQSLLVLHQSHNNSITTNMSSLQKKKDDDNSSIIEAAMGLACLQGSTKKKTQEDEKDETVQQHQQMENHQQWAMDNNNKKIWGDEDNEETIPLTFPQFLYNIISDEVNNQHLVTWLPHGRAFFVHDRDGFMEQHFGGAKFTSFTRRLKRWKFVRVAQGPEMGAFYNKLFMKGRADLVQTMVYGRADTVVTKDGVLVDWSEEKQQADQKKKKKKKNEKKKEKVVPTPQQREKRNDILRGGLDAALRAEATRHAIRDRKEKTTRTIRFAAEALEAKTDVAEACQQKTAESDAGLVVQLPNNKVAIVRGNNQPPIIMEAHHLPPSQATTTASMSLNQQATECCHHPTVSKKRKETHEETTPSPSSKRKFFDHQCISHSQDMEMMLNRRRMLEMQVNRLQDVEMQLMSARLQLYNPSPRYSTGNNQLMMNSGGMMGFNRSTMIGYKYPPPPMMRGTAAAIRMPHQPQPSHQQHPAAAAQRIVAAVAQSQKQHPQQMQRPEQQSLEVCHTESTRAMYHSIMLKEFQTLQSSKGDTPSLPPPKKRKNSRTSIPPAA